MASANHMTGLLELEQLQQQPGNCGRRASEASSSSRWQAAAVQQKQELDGRAKSLVGVFA